MIVALTDATIREVLIGSVASGLWSLAARSGAKLARDVLTLVSPPEPSVVLAIRTASERLAESIQSGPGRQQTLVAYLKSPDVECIVRQLFATSLVQPKGLSTLEAVKGEFLASMSKYLDIDEVRLQPFATSYGRYHCGSRRCAAGRDREERTVGPRRQVRGATPHAP